MQGDWPRNGGGSGDVGPPTWGAAALGGKQTCRAPLHRTPRGRRAPPLVPRLVPEVPKYTFALGNAVSPGLGDPFAQAGIVPTAKTSTVPDPRFSLDPRAGPYTGADCRRMAEFRHQRTNSVREMKVLGADAVEEEPGRRYHHHGCDG
jgi:hypothetical protein